MMHHNVTSRIFSYIGSCEDAGPVEKDKLGPSDVMRDVVYIPSSGKLEHGRISSWREDNETVFVRYHRGDTTAATHPRDMRFVKAPPK